MLLLFAAVLAGQTVTRKIPQCRDLCPSSPMTLPGRNQSRGFASCECWIFPMFLLSSYFDMGTKIHLQFSSLFGFRLI